MSHSDPIKLNCDILSAVTNNVADEQRSGFRSVISAITRMCKRMQFEGTKYLLAGTVELLVEDIPSFCLFMLANTSVRLLLLKSLQLRLHDIENGMDHVGPFCEVLQGSSTLHTLDVAFSATSPRAIVGQIVAVIPTLPSLRVLRVAEDASVSGDADTDGYQIFDIALRKSRAPLVSLSIELSDYDVDAGVGYSRRRDPLYLSSQHRTTLERLELNGGLNLIVRPGHAYEYPRLRKLILPMYRTFMPYMKPFIVSAPHLRDIQFGGTYDSPSHTRHRHDEDILRGQIVNKTQSPQDCRATNQRDQEGAGHSWPMLDSFKGTVIGAYATGLACPVARVHLLSTGGRRGTELAMLAVVLSDWRPSFLRLATDIHRARGYIPLLPSASTGWGESLETLELRLNIVEDRFDFEECFNHIAETLSTLPATSLHLEFRCIRKNLPGEFATIVANEHK